MVDVGDVVVLKDGTTSIVEKINKFAGLYMISGRSFPLYRHEFSPVKWMGDVLGNTGIGVCAKNGSEEI